MKIDKVVLKREVYKQLRESIKHNIKKIYYKPFFGFEIYTDEKKNDLYILYSRDILHYELYKVRNVFKPVNFGTGKNLKFLRAIDEKPYRIEWIEGAEDDDTVLIEGEFKEVEP